MIKVRDGYGKLIGSDYNGNIAHVLLSNGGNLQYAVGSTASTLVLRNASGQIESSVASTVAPFVISSTKVNANLNADLLDGFLATGLFQSLTSAADKNIYIKIGDTEKEVPLLYASYLGGVTKEGLFTELTNVNDSTNPNSIKVTIGGTTKYLKVTYSDLAGKVVCSSSTNDVDRPIVVTNKSNGVYYSTKVTLNYSTGNVTAPTFTGALIGNADTATTASKLSTVSKTAWGLTYWTSDGVPTSISGDMIGVGNITFNKEKAFNIVSGGSFLPTSNTDDYWWGVHRYDTNVAIAVMPASGTFQSKFETHLAFGSGNVGIGNTSPQQKLDVSGKIKADALYLTRTNGDVAFTIANEASTNGFNISATGGSSFIRFYTNSGGSTAVEQMRIHTNGYVGIGTPTPGHKLHVVGNTLASGFIKQDSSDNYVLLGGGGHKLLSELGISGGPYLPLSGGTIEGGSGNYTPLSVESKSLPEVWLQFKDTVGNTYIGSDKGQPAVYIEGDHNYLLLHSGNYYNYALPLSGGTINGELFINNSNNAIAINNGYLSYQGGTNWRVTDYGWAKSYAILHEGNYSNYALPLTGGTLTGTLTVNSDLGVGGLIVNRGHYLFARDNANADWIVTNKNWLDEYKLWHSGNDGSGSGLDADLLDGRHSSGFAIYEGVVGANVSSVAASIGYTYATQEHGGLYAGGFINFGTNGYFCQLHGNVSQSALAYRFYNTEYGKFSDWKSIAFTDSNVASATKLQTPRTIWGQSFDGTGNVSGNLEMGISKVYWNDDASNYFITVNGAGKMYHTSYYGIFFRTGGSDRLAIDSTGNVGIGTTSPSYKLHVNGQVYSTGYVRSGSSDSYVLLGGGGHKALSDFAMASAYVKKAGDTMTGPLTISTATWGNLLVLNRVNNGENWGPSIIFKFDGTHNGSLTMLSNLLYVGDNGGVRYKAWHEGNDGSGSGLDADTVDSCHKDDFLRRTATLGYLDKFVLENIPKGVTQVGSIGWTDYQNYPYAGGLWMTLRGASSLSTALILFPSYSMSSPPILYSSVDGGAWQGGYQLAYTSQIPTTMAWGSITGKPSTFTPSSHTHDDRYYTESEADSRFINYTGDTMTGALTIGQKVSARKATWLKLVTPGHTGSPAWCVGVDDTTDNSYLYMKYNESETSYFYVRHDGCAFAPHFYESSDQRLKENIKAILNKDNIPQIKEFDWKESGEHSYGLIAQELEEQGYSELVSTKDDGYKTVNYSAALSLIVGKLQVKIKELEKEIEILKNKN